MGELFCDYLELGELPSFTLTWVDLRGEICYPPLIIWFCIDTDYALLFVYLFPWFVKVGDFFIETGDLSDFSLSVNEVPNLRIGKGGRIVSVKIFFLID